MIYAEAAHFDGFHVAHCAARDDHLRARRIAAQSLEARHRAASRKGAN